MFFEKRFRTSGSLLDCQDGRWVFSVVKYKEALVFDRGCQWLSLYQLNGKKEKTIIEINPTQLQTSGVTSGFSSQWWHGSSCYLGR